MKKFSKIALALGIFFSAAFPALAEDAPLKVQGYPDQNSVRLGMMFLVRAQVLNQTAKPVDLRCHSCSYEKDWVTDTPGVIFQSWTCDKDSMERVVLKAGSAYEKNLLFYIPRADKTGPVTFRLGFKQTMANGDEIEPVWSDPITVNVLVPEGDTAAKKGTASPAAQKQAVKGQPPPVEISDSMPDTAIDKEDDPADRQDNADIDPQILKKIP